LTQILKHSPLGYRFLPPLLWTNLESLTKLVKGRAKILHMSFLIRALNLQFSNEEYKIKEPKNKNKQKSTRGRRHHRRFSFPNSITQHNKPKKTKPAQTILIYMVNHFIPH
jgi:hypothetical protein